jgi:hypothetical protein
MNLRIAYLVGVACLVAGAAVANPQAAGSTQEPEPAKQEKAANPQEPAPKADPAPVNSPAATVSPLRDPDVRHQIVQVDIGKRVASPNLLTVNVATGDSISIEVGNASGSVATLVAVGNRTRTLHGTSLLVQFRDCSAASSKQIADAVKAPGGSFCPASLLEQGDAGVIVFVGKSKDGDSAHIVVSGKATKDGPDVEVGIGVRLVRRHWNLAFSTGFAVFTRSDERYALRAIAGDDSNKIIERTSDAGTPYSIGVFAHYDHASYPFAFSFGLGTEVPMKELSLLLGLSLKARTLPLGQSGYLTAGVALRPFARLAGSFESTFSNPDAGKRTVAAATTDAALTERKYAPALFVAFSFVFAGKGESEFSGHLGK